MVPNGQLFRLHCLVVDTMAEWLRRRMQVPLGSARAGSNPARVVFLTLYFCYRLTRFIHREKSVEVGAFERPEECHYFSLNLSPSASVL